MSESTSSLAQPWLQTTGFRWCIFHRASWEVSDSSAGENKGKLKARLGFGTALDKAFCALCGKAPDRDWKGAQPSVLQGGRPDPGSCWWQVAVAGGSVWAGHWHGVMLSREGFGLGKVPISFSFPGVDVQPEIWWRYFKQKKMCLLLTLMQALGCSGLLLEAWVGKARLCNTAVHHHVFPTVYLTNIPDLSFCNCL